MIVFDRKTIERAKPFDFTWEERDFVATAQEFVLSKTNKVLIVSGLRGSGTTTGMLQLAGKLDGLYLSSERGENEAAQNYIDLIEMAPQKVIILDEYTWIRDRERLYLDSIVSSFVQHGKRIILTGRESATLESLRHKDLIHRAECLHVSRVSFDEFKRLNSSRLPQYPEQIYDLFLQEGGIFQGYVNETAKGMDEYIRKSIIENLYAYIGRGSLSKGQIAAAVYTVLYNAVHDEMGEEMPREQFCAKALDNLSGLGIEDAGTSVNPLTVKSVGEILASIGVLVKPPNIGIRKSPDNGDRLYIVNPAITWNLAKSVYNPARDKKRILGQLKKAAVIVERAYSEFVAEHDYLSEVKGTAAPGSPKSRRTSSCS